MNSTAENLNQNFNDFKVADITLADWGRKEICLLYTSPSPRDS